jgi:hypothetical protein
LLADATIPKQTAGSVAFVAAPKVGGLARIHAAVGVAAVGLYKLNSLDPLLKSLVSTLENLKCDLLVFKKLFQMQLVPLRGGWQHRAVFFTRVHARVGRTGQLRGGQRLAGRLGGRRCRARTE